MSLKDYYAKRDLKRSPEPAGHAEHDRSGDLRFVIQKHDASHLHYDLRLELDGVLKSWAVPKGPSLDPNKRRLAMRTEDHPLEYADFEGVIPKGSYGAGKVIIWDEGTYHLTGVEDRAENENLLRKALDRGSLKLSFNGQKIKGEYSLVKTHQEENSWLLIKKRDQYASKDNILLKDKSVRTGRPVEEAENLSPSIEEGSKSKARPQPGGNSDARQVAPSSFLTNLILGGAAKTAMPGEIKPMLASLTDAPFDKPGWIFELKWDGFRAIAETHQDHTARLYSRRAEDYGKEFAPILKDLQKIDFDAVIDGEIVVVDEKGRGDFKLLQQYRRTGKGILVFYAFDLIYLAGYDLHQLPLLRRKEILRQALPSLPHLKYSDHIEEDGVSFFKLALENDLEGIMAKNGASQYRQGVRSTEWLKIKTHHRQDAVIGGYTAPRGARSYFGALLLGVYDRDDLIYIGHTGGGLDETELKELKNRLDKLKQKQSPFKTQPKTNAPATWVKPDLVCEVRFAGWTDDGRMRQPVFLGLRSDKEPGQVRREQSIPVKQAVERKYKIRRNEQKNTVEIDGHSIELTNQKKVFWPEEAITKGDLIAYYRQISSVILPYLVDRPQSLHRFPNGITGKHFFQKDVEDVPQWIKTIRLESGSNKEGAIDYLLCQDEASLVFMANLGCIEINPWISTANSLENPSYAVIDLDPDQRTFKEVIQVARVVHEILDQIDAINLVKTSGQTGLHICIPLESKYTYEQSRLFSQMIAQLVYYQLPEITSLERQPKKRQGKIYLDYLQNRKGQTIVAPYSLRPQPGAPVSTPLEWDELDSELSPSDFTIKNIQDRIARKGDLFRAVLGPGIDMATCLEKLRNRVSVFLK